MRVRLKRFLALLLAAAILASFCSVTVFAGEVAKGTNGKTIYLGWTFYTDINVSQPVSGTLDANTEYYARLGFYGNPVSEGVTNTICSFSLYGTFDTNKIEIEQGSASIIKGDIGISKTIKGNEFNIQGASDTGITDTNEQLLENGCLARIKFKTKIAVASEDLQTLFNVTATLSSGEETNMGDGVKKLFTIVELPHLAVTVNEGAEFYDTSTPDEIKAGLSVSYIDPTGYSAPLAGEDVIVTLPTGGLKVGENTITVTGNGHTSEVTINVVEDEVTGIKVTHDPDKMSYSSGQTLVLDGIVVKAVHKSGKETDINVADLFIKPKNGAKLKTTDGGAEITVMYGSMQGSTKKPLTVNKADLNDAQIADIDSIQYQYGAEIEPTPEITLNGDTLVNGTDYDLTYVDNTNVGTATLTATGKGTEYTGSKDKSFQITQATDELTLKVNNVDGDAVNVIYGDALTFTGNGAVINADTASETKIQYKTENGAYADFDYDTVLNAGTYTFKAVRLDTPNVAATESTNEVVVTITQKTITTPSVTITGFGKGAAVGDVKYSANDLNAVLSWYEGEGDPSTLTPVSATDKFKADTTYTLVLTLTPASGNYVLDPDTTVIVNGLDGQKTASLTISGNSGVAIVTGTTGAKDKTKRASGTNLGSTGSVRYGDTLGSVQLVAEPNTDGLMVVAYIDGKETTISVPGKFEWKYPNDKVGDACELGKANRHKVVFKPDNDDLYEGFEEWVGVSVQKKVLNISDLVWTWSNDTLTYTGKPQSIEMNIPTGIAEYVDVTYGNETEGHTNTATNAGTYTAAAVVTPKDANNISLGGTTADDQIRRVITKEWKINKAELTLPDKEFNAYYKSASVDKTLADLGLSDLADEPELDLLFSNLENTKSAANVNKVTDANGKITGISIKLDATSRVNDVVGVHVTVSSKNYEDAEFNIRITLEDKARDTSTMSVSVADITYGETPNPQVTGKPAETSDLTYSYVRTHLGASPKYNEETIQNAPAGKYELTVTCENATKYFIATDNFEIKPREITANDVSFGYTLTYTGEKQTQTVIVTINGTTLTAGTDYTADPSGVNGETKTSEDSMSLTAPGTYTVTVKGTGNYKGTVEKIFTVGKASLKNADVGAIAPVDYNGTARTPKPAVFFNEIKLTEGTDYELSYSNNTNVGTATITITAKADSAHFTGSTSTTFKIEKANPTITLVRAASVDYTGAQYSNKNVEVTKPSDIEVTYEYYLQNDTACTTPVKPIDAGSYKVRISFAGNDNYNAVQPTATVDFTINKVNHPISITAASVTYTGAPYSETNITVKPTCEVTFTYYASETSTDPIAHPTDVGKYWVVASYAGTDNYNSSTSARVSFSITKATPPTPAEVKVDGEDKTLKDLEDSMRKDLGAIEGEFTWRDSDGKELPSNTKIEANKEYEWTFTPMGKDAKNYRPIYGKTTPYVRDDLSWLPGVINGGSTFNFRDVTRYDYFYTAVKWAAENGIASGTSRYTFSPDAVCTRAQTVTFLWRAAGSPMPSYRISPFTDVNYGDYYYNAVLWAVEQGITTGLTATTFGPDKTVTRGQVAMFLYRAASAVKPNITNSFTDVKSTAYNYDAILWAYDNRITTGTSTTTFSPDAFCTRAQIVTFLYRFYQGR